MGALVGIRVPDTFAGDLDPLLASCRMVSRLNPSGAETAIEPARIGRPLPSLSCCSVMTKRRNRSRLKALPAPSRPALSSSLYREVGALLTFSLQGR
jgi:hypothetical protein